MSQTSKTGLIPTQRKIVKTFKRKKVYEEILPTSTVARAVEFSLRPFGGLHNPYSKGCSVLCNHPAPTAVRNIIKQVKDSLSSETKAYWQDGISQREKFEKVELDNSDQIPEELFRRYTDTDSRPLTPSPTTTSIRTRTSSFLNARRCVTPEPRQDNIIKRKKIILDLRRSHSQETLYWKASSEVSQTVTTIDTQSNLIPTGGKSTPKPHKIEEPKPKSPVIPKEPPAPEEVTIPPSECIHEKDLGEEGEFHRRGKKRKKTKPQGPTTRFHLSQDPETQVATLGPDSLTASTRPSLVPNSSTNPLNTDLNSKAYKNAPTQLKNSYLTHEAFRVLKTELDVDVIENTFDRYLNRALKEAIKYITPKDDIAKKCTYVEENTKFFFESKIEMPRKFSKSASRFEIPLDMNKFQKISVFDYLSKNVWVARQRKQLYKKVFRKYILKDEEIDIQDENETPSKCFERKISVKDFRKAIKEVLGFYGTDEIIKQIEELISIQDYTEINFRSWCGIISFAERFAVDPIETDSCDELEKTDFDTIEQRMETLNLSENLLNVLKVIRRGHGIREI